MCLESKIKQNLTATFEKGSTFEDYSIQEIILFIHYYLSIIFIFLF